jgi:hypothetical protein
MRESVTVAAASVPIALSEDLSPFNTTESLIYVAIAVGVITAVAVVAYVVNRLLRRRRRESQWGLFQGLCQAHGLGRGSRLLLRRIAQYHSLRQPARLFTEPDLLHPSSGLAMRFQGRLDEIGELRNRLFT